jgi:acetyl esterase/lipase
LIGESAGGTIVSLLAHHLKPLPRAMVNIYGPTDFLDPHYSPNTPPNSIDIQPLDDKWTEEDCRKAITSNSKDLSKAITVCPYVFDIPIDQVRDQWLAPKFEYTEQQRFNWQVKRYMRTHKLLFKVILRTVDLKDEKEEMEVFKKWSPYHMLDGKSKGEYPPTWFLNGEADGVVPIKQAENMRERLDQMGVDTGVSYEPGQGHEFDNKYTVSLTNRACSTPLIRADTQDTSVKGYDQYILPILEFIDKHTKA